MPPSRPARRRRRARRRGQRAQPPRLLRHDCEAASFSFSRGRQMTLDPHPGSSLTFRLHCPGSEEGDGRIAMSGSITLRDAAGRPLGRGRIPTRAGRRCGRDLGGPPVRVPVERNARGQRLLSRPTGARVTVSLRGHNFPPARAGRSCWRSLGARSCRTARGGRRRPGAWRAQRTRRAQHPRSSSRAPPRTKTARNGNHRWRFCAWRQASSGMARQASSRSRG